MSAFADYDTYDAIGLAEIVRKGEVTSGELIEEAIRRIELLNPTINAVVTTNYDQARTLARETQTPPDQPFAGVPFLLKDLISEMAGIRLTSGSRCFENFVPARDSELVRRYKEAGLIVVGKTNVPEFGITPFTEPELFGPTRNPWDTERTPGGSSGGSAAAVAAGIVPAAHGNDGGGSIRIPASCCGLFGLKPTRGRTPTGPERGQLLHGFAVEHVLTRTVRDSAALLDATCLSEPGSPNYPASPSASFLNEVAHPPDRLRIAFTSDPFLGNSVHPDCVEGLRNTAGLLEELGHEVQEDAPPVDRSEFARAFLKVMCAEVATAVEQVPSHLGRKPARTDFEATTWLLHLMGQRLGAVDLNQALGRLEREARRIGRFFERYDVLLTPALARPPIAIGELQPSAVENSLAVLIGRLRAVRVLEGFHTLEKLADNVFEFIPYTPVFNATGQPAMSVPLHWNTQGLPIGMHFAGRFGDEATLFRLAGQLEQARPWKDRRPPLSNVRPNPPG